MKTVARFFKLAFMLILICACLLQLGCTQIPKEKKQEKIGNTIIELPRAKIDGKASLEEVLNKRKSVRDLTEKDLSLEQISQLLWAAQGKSLDAISGATRTAPSAGALHPLEIYIVKKDGIYHYDSTKHTLRKILEEDCRSDLSVAALGQVCIEKAAVNIIITAMFERTAVKYGDRANQYVLIETGHAAQNILLQAEALNFGAVPIGAFDDKEVQKVLFLPEEHKPLYIIPVGHPI